LTYNNVSTFRKKSHHISTTNADRDSKIFVDAASQELSGALNIITLASTIHLLEISKVLHCSRYSSETNADSATKIIWKMPHARSY
jgi:hypothetical protein